MSDIDITPEEYRTAVKVIKAHRQCDWGPVFFEDKAETIEREQAAKKRVDELAQVFCRAEEEAANYGVGMWDSQSGIAREGYRAGIRAVLAKLEETS